MKDGREQTITGGAVVHIAAGSPHQMIIPKAPRFTLW